MKQLKAVKLLLALVQTVSGLPWSEIHLRVIEQSRSHSSPPPPDWPVIASSFNRTPPFFCIVSLGDLMKKHGHYKRAFISKSNCSILCLPLIEFLYPEVKSNGLSGTCKADCSSA